MLNAFWVWPRLVSAFGGYKRVPKKLCLILFLFMSLLTAANAKSGAVRGSYVNLRQDARFNSPIISKKMRGEVYQVLFEKGSWVKASFADGTVGWLYKTLAETAEVEAKPKNTEKQAKAAGKQKEKAPKTDKDKQKETKKDKASVESAAISAKKQAAEHKAEAPKEAESERNAKVEKTEVAATAEELYNSAITLYEKKQYAQALDANLMALKKAPQNAEILNNIANCQFKMGRVEDAIESWKAALKISSRSSKICNNLGIAYYQIDDNKTAIEYYKKAIMFEPEFSDPHYNIASVYGFTGQFSDAIASYKQFLKLSSDPTMKKLADERIEYCERRLSKLSEAAKPKNKQPRKATAPAKAETTAKTEAAAKTEATAKTEAVKAEAAAKTEAVKTEATAKTEAAVK